MNRRLWRLRVAAAFLALLHLAGCKRHEATPPPPDPEVAVVTVQPRPVVLTSELPGRTSGYLVAEIRPQVNGLIQKRLFVEGSDVKQNQVLYEIDPAPYQAALDQASANLLAARKAADRAQAALNAGLAGLKRHQSTLTLATSNYERYENLFKTNVISEMERDQAASNVEVAEAAMRTAEAQVESDREAVGAAEAAIQQAEAAMQTARINLGYTKITAPIAGRIGRSNVTEGAIVTAYQPLPLATIQQLDPIYVDVPQSTAELNRLRRSLKNGRLKENDSESVKIVLEDGTPYPQEGSLKFRDVSVDPTTGTVVLRIVVPNPDGILLPGMFVRAIIDEGINERAILVPQQAVARDSKGDPSALVVDPDGKVQQRALVADRAVGDQWLILSGLSQGDRVIVEGTQKIRPGATVRTVEFGPGAAPAAKPEGAPPATPPANRP